MNIAFSILLCAAGIALIAVVISDRLLLPLLAEFGMAVAGLGLIAAATVLTGDSDCSAQTAQGVLAMVGIGALLVLLSWRLKAREQRARNHRRSDPQEIDYSALRNVRGGGR